MNRKHFITLLARKSRGQEIVYETPSYLNSGGTGNRQSEIVIDLSAGLWNGAGANKNTFIDGATTVSTFYPDNAESVVGEYLRLNFTTKRLITEIKIYNSSIVANGGVWKWQGADDAISWTDIGASFQLSAINGATTFSQLSSNTVGYKYYQMVGVSGVSNWNAYWNEIEFKIGNPI